MMGCIAARYGVAVHRVQALPEWCGHALDAQLVRTIACEALSQPEHPRPLENVKGAARTRPPEVGQVRPKLLGCSPSGQSAVGCGFYAALACFRASSICRA